MKKYIKNYKSFSLILFIFLVVFSTFAVTLGSVSLKTLDVWKIIVNKSLNNTIFSVDWKNNVEIIVWNLRVPRIITGILAGAALSLVGILMQALTKNPLASPYILGISSGASTGAVLAILFFNASFLHTSISAFILGTLTAIIVFYFSSTGSFSSTKLVLIGAAISSIFSALTSLIVMLAPNEKNMRSALFWMAGSLSSSNWEYIPFLLISIIVSIILIYLKYNELNILVTGDESALSLGVDTKKIRLLITIISTFLTGIVIANTGIIAFVGLIIPHISRAIVGGNHKKIIPVSILMGSIFLVSADTLTRFISDSQEIPIGIITSLFGAPFFLSMLRKKSYKFGGE